MQLLRQIFYLTSLCSPSCLFKLVEPLHQLPLFSLHLLLLPLDGRPPLLLALQLIPAEHGKAQSHA